MKNKVRLLAVAGVAVIALAGCGSAATATGGHSAPARPSATVSAPVLSAEQIAARMKLGKVFAYNATTDPNNLLGRQGEYTSKVNWGGSTSDASDNSIEVFATKADAIARVQYLSGFKPPFGDGYDYLHGSALLRLSSDYTPSQARAIQAQFDQVQG